VSEAFSTQILSLPMYPEMQREQLEYVASLITGYVKAHFRNPEMIAR